MEATGRRSAGFPNLQPATRNLQPGCNVLVKTFLCFESRGDNDDRAMRKKMSQ
jgi:hypothetical protein